MSKYLDNNISKKLCDLIAELSELTTSIEVENISAYLQRFDEIYYPDDETDVNRHTYSAITSFIYTNYKADSTNTHDKLTMCIEYIRAIQKAANNDEKYKRLDMPLHKLIDHIETESLRVSMYSDITKKLGDSAHQNIDALNEKIEELSRKAGGLEDANLQAEKLVKNLNNDVNRVRMEKDIQTVTVLGIFTGIVFAFSGGFTLLGSAFSNIANISKSNINILVIMILLVGCVLGDIIYVLLHFVASISDVRLKKECEYNCDECKHLKRSPYQKRGNYACSFFKRYWFRHPAIILTNGSVIAISLVLLMISYVLS